MGWPVHCGLVLAHGSSVRRCQRVQVAAGGALEARAESAALARRVGLCACMACAAGCASSACHVCLAARGNQHTAAAATACCLHYRAPAVLLRCAASVVVQARGRVGARQCSCRTGRILLVHFGVGGVCTPEKGKQRDRACCTMPFSERIALWCRALSTGWASTGRWLGRCCRGQVPLYGACTGASTREAPEDLACAHVFGGGRSCCCGV